MSKKPRRESKEDEPEMRRCSRTKSLMLGLVPCSHLVKRPAQQRYLYLVLEDWERGYSVHRVGEDDFDSNVNLDARPTKCPLIRIQAQHAFACSFTAHGTKILAMQPAGFSPGIPVFDTQTLEMAVYPSPKTRSLGWVRKSVYTSVGDRLVSFVHGCLEVLMGPEPPPIGESWSWTSAEQPPPFCSFNVSSYAVHPDGRTIFMSFKNFDIRSSTFSFNTERLEWTNLGDWILPFKGQAHYDRELDAWVGICRFKEGAGHLCCCNVPPTPARCKTMPAWKLSKDILFDEEHSTGHLGATLVYMGDSRFCLVESRRVPEDSCSTRRLRVLTMTYFGLKYDKVGELVTTEYRAFASISYQTALRDVSQYLDPVAFWM